MIFIWIPKTAGMSVYNTLSSEIGMELILNPGDFDGGGHVSFGHISIHSLVQGGFIDGEYYSSSRFFTVVRDPYTRAVSLWKYFVACKKLTLDTTLLQFLSAIAVQDCKPGLYNVRNYSQCSCQVNWLLPNIQVIRFEGLSDFFKLEFGFDLKRHDNKSKLIELDHMSYYDEETIKLVNEIYRKDFVMLNYQMI